MKKQIMMMWMGLGVILLAFLGAQATAQQPSSKPSSTPAKAPASAPASTPAKAAKDDASHIVEGEHSPETLYKTFCAGCHDIALAGAPKTGDKEIWTNLLKVKGMKGLVENTYKGKGLMPKRGGCAGCSETEIKAVVEHMLKKAKVETK